MTLLSSLKNGTTDLLSELLLSPETISSAQSISTLDKYYNISGTTSNYNINLPASSGNTGKFVGFIVNSSANKLFSIIPNGSETIDGDNILDMWKDESVLLYCNGSGWNKILYKKIPMMCHITGPTTTSVGINTVVVINFTITNINNTGFPIVNFTNNTIEIPRTGNYHVYGNWRMAQLGANRYCQCTIQKNAGNVLLGNYIIRDRTVPAVLENYYYTANGRVRLQKGDLIRLTVFQNYTSRPPITAPYLGFSEIL
jgi:hypothetical protein